MVVTESIPADDANDDEDDASKRTGQWSLHEAPWWSANFQHRWINGLQRPLQKPFPLCFTLSETPGYNVNVQGPL